MATKKEKVPAVQFDPVAARERLKALLASEPVRAKTIADEIKELMPEVSAAKAKGHSNDAIAEALGVSPATVRKVVKEVEDAAAAAKASASPAKPAVVASVPAAAAAKK